MEQMSFVMVYYATVVILWPIKLTQIYSYLTQGRNKWARFTADTFYKLVLDTSKPTGHLWQKMLYISVWTRVGFFLNDSMFWSFDYTLKVSY